VKQDTESLENVAVIGIACRFPGARNSHQFWNNLAFGIGPTEPGLTPAAHSGDAEKPRTSPAPDIFDAEFFDVEAREAELLDPQQRIFLECAWEAMEDSGHDLTSFPGPVGVFAASAENTYAARLLSHPDLRPDTGFILKLNNAGQLAHRVARHLNLHGPSLVVQAGSSSSLMAIASACRSLLSYECDVALAGGISIQTGDEVIGGSEAVTNGGGVLVLRRLSDALADRDTIRAVIRGTAVNTDGGLRSNPIQAGVDSQAEVIALAQAIAGVAPPDISYVEMSGGSESVADGVEIAALMRVFQSHTESEKRCALGSVKATVGDLGPASGMASIIKTILALQHQQIPSTTHFSGYQALEKASGPFFVGTGLLPRAKSKKPRCAGVSAFELGGSNVHIILEEAPFKTAPRKSRSAHLLLLSARSPERCDSSREQLAQQLETAHLDLQDVSYTLQVGRRHFPWRFAVACNDLNGTIHRLRDGHEDEAIVKTEGVPRRPVFLFPGLGTHYPGMSVRLYDAEPVFARYVDQCCDLLKNHLGTDLRDNILSLAHAKELNWADSQAAMDFARMVSNSSDPPGELDGPELAQPALFIVEYALARLFMHWGVKPSAMAGYSIGEYVAACLAGVFSLEDALKIVARRSLLTKSLSPSSMLAVPLSEAEAAEFTQGKIGLCGVHGPRLCVLGGTTDAILALQSVLQEKGIASRQLRTTRAFHTNLMKPVAPMLRSALEEIELRPPSIPYISNVTGRWIEDAQATSPDYWVEHLCAPVRFSQGVQTLEEIGHRSFLEIGPGKSLTGLVLAQLQSDGIQNGRCVATLPSVYETNPDEQNVIEALGDLWKNGVDCDWERFHEGQNPRRTSICISPMQGQRYWVDVYHHESRPVPLQHNSTKSADGSLKLESVSLRASTVSDNFGGEYHREIKHPPRTDTERVMASIWCKRLDVRNVGVHDDFFQLGGDSLIAMQILTEVRKVFGIRIELRTFLSAPTVAALAAYADRQLSPPDTLNNVTTGKSL
jgi:phthiocerol/phenolphthiocerol synthesis type-I polyketide synthase E